MKFRTKLAAALTTAAVGTALGLAALGQPGSAAAQDLPGGTWGPSLTMDLKSTAPAGTHFDSGRISDVSCTSPGDCAAIGVSYDYTSTAGVDDPYPFVVSETGGVWGAPTTVSGIASGNPNQGVTSEVSCGAPGECAAAWTYVDASGDGHAYLLDESGGTWGPAQPVTMGTAGTWLTGVSCAAPGDCAAVGDYLSGSIGTGLPFVMDSSGGVWGTPREVPGIADLSSPSPVNAGLESVSCVSAGNCVAGGAYRTTSSSGQSVQQPLVATETGGSWGQAQSVLGVAALDPGGSAVVRVVSCSASGGCTAIGFYPASGGENTWVASESGGTWGPAAALPALAASGRMLSSLLSCSPQGYCAIAGAYAAPGAPPKAFVATSDGGAWTAQNLPGAMGTNSNVTGVSCGATGYCAVAGYYYPAGSGHPIPFLANDVNGTWANAQDAPVTVAGLTTVDRVSCAGPGYCTAIGQAGGTPFTLSEATAAAVTLNASAPTVTYGDEQAETLTATVSSPAGGTPTGTVTVTDGTLTVCRITLANGTGSCQVPPTAIPGGTDQLTATYLGDASYTTATGTATVTVAKSANTLVLAISPATVTFGTTYSLVVSATAVPKFAGTPTGGPEVYLNGMRICVIVFTGGGKGSCPLPWGYNAGRYQLTASYPGDGNFTTSTAAPQYLTIAREKTSTSLALSHTTVTYGYENAEKISVTISSPAPNSASGKVTVKAGASTICVIAVKGGNEASGSCTMESAQLRRGTYWVTSSYSGNVNYLPSGSAGKWLKVG